MESHSDDGVDVKRLENESKSKPGLIFLSTIPQTMNVTMIRQIFSEYGELGRVFLQPNAKEKKKGKPAKHFTEGWVEFKKKKIAKAVASSLNNTLVGGKRRSRYYDSLWNIKYLSGFKWTHLTERLSYEKAVHDQRLRTEIAQVKRETNFFVQNFEANQKRQRARKRNDGDDDHLKRRKIRQKFTDDEIKSQQKTVEQSSVLENVFTG